MLDWLSQAARRRPGHPFLRVGDRILTFADMEARVDRAASSLLAAGVGRRDRVALWASNDLPSAVAFFAVPRVGAANVLLNTRQTPRESRSVAGLAGASAVVGAAPELGLPIIDLDSGGPAVDHEPDPADLHSVVFTSGTSGRPRGVRLSWRNLEASARASAEHLEHNLNDVWLAVLPLFHVGGFMILVRSAREQTTVVLEHRFHPDRVAAMLSEGKLTLASVVPTMLERILESTQRPFRSVRAVLVGGGPVPQRLLDAAAEKGLPVLPTYGMTETCSQVATGALDEALHPVRRVFPVPTVELRSVDRRIQVRGPMVSPGYLDEADRTPGAWLDTGDAGTVDDEGALHVLGRLDDIIVTGGENVMASEVEDVVARHPEVDEVAVVGVDSHVWGEMVTAVYTGTVEPARLEEHVRRYLAPYKVPKRWVRVPALPRLPIGKVDRQAVVVLAENG